MITWIAYVLRQAPDRPALAARGVVWLIGLVLIATLWICGLLGLAMTVWM